MRVAGIVAEYNPFHQGHLRLISKVREELGEKAHEVREEIKDKFHGV